MKKLCVLLLAIWSGGLRAEERSTPSPTLKAKQEISAPFCEKLVRQAVKTPFVGRPRVARREVARKFVSEMPVVQPTAEVDKKMPIKAPDASVDHKLLVKTPDVEPVK